ncbi:MAG TPA: apolipoprotein N-acyltransferase [Fimbriiglobus sp.]|nr:apolipoprotein N-acyltransferase [Fimbriiglobus sp.]
MLLPAVASGVLLWTAFFPLDLGPVAFVAMVPFLTLVRAENVGPTRRYLAAFAGGLVFSVLALKWIRVAHPMMAYFAWPGLSLYCALYWPLALLLLRKLDRLNLPLAATFPVVWVALEYVRAHAPTGFAFLEYVHLHQFTGFGWYFLGYTQHRVLPLVQAADLGGVYLVSAAVAAVNGGVYEWAVRSKALRWLLRWPPAPHRREWVREAYITTGAVSVPLLLICYGTMQLVHPPFEKGPRVAAIQGNLPQNDKMVRGERSDETPRAREYDTQARLAARAGPNTPAPDLIVWPETCWPDDWLAVRPGVPDDPQLADTPARVAAYQKKLGDKAVALTGTSCLLGLNTQEWDGTDWRRFNSAVLVRPDGGFAGRYDKIHLVPFGEYVPLKDYLPWMQTFTPYARTNDYSCTPGESWTRFELPTAKGTFRFGMLICYEDTDPAMARRYNPTSGQGPGVDFLVNISNDGWFDGSEEHEQHLAICRFRAVEARRSIIRAVNMGISALIDPDGKVAALPIEESWAASKKTRGVVRADIPLDHRGSFYAAAGDWVPGLFWGLIAAGLVTRRLRRRQTT